MPTLLSCPHCAEQFSVLEAGLGKSLECPFCGKAFLARALGTVAASSPSAATNPNPLSGSQPAQPAAEPEDVFAGMVNPGGVGAGGPVVALHEDLYLPRGTPRYLPVTRMRSYQPPQTPQGGAAEQMFGGEPEESHGIAQTFQLMGLAGFGLCIVMGLFIAGVAFFAGKPAKQVSQFGPKPPKQQSDSTSGYVIVYGMASIFIVGGVWSVMSWLHKRSWHLDIYPEGFICEMGKKSCSGRWDDVDAMYVRMIPGQPRNRLDSYLGGKDRVYVIAFRDGRRAEISPFLGHNADLWDAVKERTLRFLLPLYRQEIKSGGQLQFGELLVNPVGLRLGDRALAWNDIAKVPRYKHHFSIVSLNGRDWGSFSTDTTPNAHVLIALIRERVKTEQG